MSGSPLRTATAGTHGGCEHQWCHRHPAVRTEPASGVHPLGRSRRTGWPEPRTAVLVGLATLAALVHAGARFGGGRLVERLEVLAA